MTAQTHIYTSITSNYLPKARALAASVKRVAPNAMFHLLLSDDLPSGFDLEQEDFDTIIFADSLPIENFKQWSFSHSVVELCTAVKGVALETIFERYAAERVFYFDPDIVLFSQIDALEKELIEHSVLLTPHQTKPETSTEAVIHNEICSLKHGVFNLGFVGVHNDPEGRAFAKWWAERLFLFCHDDTGRGLFTDQKWANLAPCLFDRVKILRSPVYNVATWNLTARYATGSLKKGILINGEPLVFYHFSGMDSGGQENMLKLYGKHSPVLFDLRKWYVAECERFGQSDLGKLPSKYDTFDNGEKISRKHRLLYRQRIDLQKHFPEPFSTLDQGGFQAWCALNQSAETTGEATPTHNIEFKFAPHNMASNSIGEDISTMADYFSNLAGSDLIRSQLKRFFLRFISSGLRMMASFVRR